MAWIYLTYSSELVTKEFVDRRDASSLPRSRASRDRARLASSAAFSPAPAAPPASRVRDPRRRRKGSGATLEEDRSSTSITSRS